MVRTSFLRAFCLAFLFLGSLRSEPEPVLKVLFLGDSGHHQPALRLRTIAPAMLARGIQLVYTEDVADLDPAILKRYDGLLIYANIDRITKAQENALLGYVEAGGGLFALHCASYCFRNSDRYVDLVGAQFNSHKTGVVRTRIVAPDNPVMRGFKGFESWDETYVHIRHNERNRTVLEQRGDEPWTWIRTQGKGRVFYTAWGHDDRTWSNPGFQDLVERGLRYVAGEKLPDALARRAAVPALELVEQKGIPYYLPGQRSFGDASWPLMQKPLSPEDSMKHLIVPAGFEVQLVASEPQVRKPIVMNWDERGRLWIAETLDYPNRVLAPGEAGRDRIVICEDTDHDGRMDRFTVFAEGLNIPTGFTFANGGIVLVQSPNTLFLKDTDGDGRADVKEILFSGWGRKDTHAGPNNLVYGFDNWIWGVLGYSGFDGSVGGEGLKFTQGIYRFTPEGRHFEYLRTTNNNTWGLGFTEDGIAFASTANNNPNVYPSIPNRYYTQAGLPTKVLGSISNTARFLPVTTRVRQVDVHWGYTAAAGHAFYTARAYPREYWNRIAFVAEPTGHLVGQFIIEPAQANFRAHNPNNLIASDDEWFAPIMAEVGPDGAVWIIDWYNYIVQHNPTPRGFTVGLGNAYENDLRDKRYGRIYRIVWKGKGSTNSGTARQVFTLEGASPEKLVATLANDNLLWRKHAQRLLVERNRKDVVPLLLKLVSDPSVDEIGLNPGAIHALWTLHGLGAIDALPEVQDAVRRAMGHTSAAVRQTAVSVLPHTAGTMTAVLKANLLNDADPQVRLAALLSLASGPASPEAGKALFAMLNQAGLKLDQWTVDGAKIAASTHRASFLASASPEQVASARAFSTGAGNATTTLDTFENIPPGKPAQWKVAVQSGTGDAEIVGVGRNSSRSLLIQGTGDGAEIQVTRRLAVKPQNRYELSAYLETDNVIPQPGALGVFVSIPEIQQPRAATSSGMKETSKWNRIRLSFDTGDLTEVTLAWTMGGGARVTGKAWIDDLTLTDLGPSDETIADPLLPVLAHLLEQGVKRPDDSEADANSGAIVLKLGVIPDLMKYDQPEITIKAGEKGRLVLLNNDHMQHNAIVVLPGRIDAVGALADAMLTDPQALSRSYIPESPDVLFAVPLVNPGESVGVNFTAPSAPGRYPIICTFPGHWRMMQSVLVVK
ncbi:MAG: ThuA domain-containing protein [Opitutaceae bacterium]|nr:ThuA domain-containing protein [Opitutaceae bacterium]